MNALLVDLYDTIVWTDWPALSAHMTGQLGVDAPTLWRAFEATRQARGTGQHGSAGGDLAALLRACDVGVDDAGLARVTEQTLAFMQAHVRLYDDVLPVLRRLRAHGTRVAVVSNCDHATRPVVDALGLGREVDALVLSCEVGSLKPDPAIFRQALERLAASPADSVFVDDQPGYLDGAAALGLRTYRMVREPQHQDAAPGGRHPVITSLAELP